MKKIASGTTFLNAGEILQTADVRSGMRVADLGCGGAGYFVLQAARMVSDAGVVYAIDVLKPALSALMSKVKLENLSNIVPVWSNVEVYRGTKIINDGSLDMAFLVQLLFQSRHQKEIFRETARMLKSGGTALVVDWLPGNVSFGPQDSAILSSESVRALAQTAGFKGIKEFKAGPYHYGLLFEKV